MTAHITLGTRGSPLALAQARMVADALIAAHGWNGDAVAILPIKTSGDMIQDRPLAEVGGKALWTKELDRAMFDGRIDIAVHSMKDVETFRPEALAIAAMLPRADPRDRLIGAGGIDAIPRGGRVGTSSPRRAAQLLHLRPDLSIVNFRGNVATRLARLEAGEADATLLAAAGLDRLGRPDIGTTIEIAEMLPAPAQGAVGIEVRSDDARVRALVGAIDHAPTHAAVTMERALLAGLEGTCHSPVAALATVDGGRLGLAAEILSPDGVERHQGTIDASAEDGAAAAGALARTLLERASPALRALFGGGH
jgi:hydroxymethylbilane synthase